MVAGDVWFPQPAPNDHIWRSMPNHGMTAHTSGTSLSAQARYAAGVREILECFFEKTYKRTLPNCKRWTTSRNGSSLL